MAGHTRKAKGGPPSDFKKGGKHQKKEDASPDNSHMMDIVGKRSGQELPEAIRKRMEFAYDTDFSKVRVFEDDQAEQAGALALARGNEVHFKPGVYAPDTARGKEILGHELAHVVQQGGEQAPARPWRKGDVNISRGLEREADVAGARAARGDVAEVSGTAEAGDVHLYTPIAKEKQSDGAWKADMPLRVSDDGNMAVGQRSAYGSHQFWTNASQLNAANAILESNKSVMKLTTGSEKLEGEAPDGSGERALLEVVVENRATGTKGDDMSLWADCGKSFRDVSGIGEGSGGNSSETTAVYNWKKNPDPKILSKFVAIMEKIGMATALDGTKSGEAETASAKPEDMKNEILSKFMSTGDLSLYEAMEKHLSKEEMQIIDEFIGINRFASPEVGEGYTISSGGEFYEGKKTWNFHWAGVVMKSGGDNVVLENYAVGDSKKQNTKWKFQMYGPPSKEGQTFHEQHEGMKQHGKTPTTMRVRKRS
ncbi:MAG: DUF4157 domain-containing protein [Deltaproteobacteria bacterium]|nr:DUF4157 domain-containing protein [Deltaproteobacteria bacterium]